MVGVDLNRGVHQRRHPDGQLIGCYKDDPGLYFDENGDPVSEVEAARCGHDVKGAKLQRMKKEKLAEAKRAIDAEVAELEQRVGDEVDYEQSDNRPDLSDAPKFGFGIYHVGGLYYQVIDTQGNVVSGPKGILKSAAEKLVSDLIAAASAEPASPAADE